ncbi:MAG: mechanosensitive ion channel protein MscS, partial [Arenibacterium sp.]
MRAVLLVSGLFWALFALSGVAIAQDTTPASEAQQLIELLEDDAARDALIASLKDAAALSAQPPAPEEEVSFGRQVAQVTSDFFETAARSLSAALSGLMAVSSTLGALDGDQLAALWDALVALAVVFAATTLSYVLLRAYAKKIYVQMGERAHDWDVLRRLAVLIATTLIDVAVVLIAWGLGYLAALYLHGDPGTMGVRQSLYLNAFLLVGLARVVLRMILSPSTHELRFVDISDAAAKRMSFWLGTIATIVGYGQLLIVPIVNQQASFSAGRGVSTLLAFLAIGVALVLVLRNRQAVVDWLLGPNPEDKPSVIRFMSRSWFVPILIYLIGLAIIVAARPDGLIWPVLLTTAQVIGVLILGVIVTGGLSRASGSKLRLPEAIQDRLPSLEERLNTFLTRGLGILRILVIVFVICFALDVAGLLDFRGFLQSDFGSWLISTAISVGLILFFGLLVWLALVSWVDYRLNPDFGIPTSREQTLLTLLRNAATIVLAVIILMFALAEIGIDIAPLIASAGCL